jgi:hypothetical protein
MDLELQEAIERVATLMGGRPQSEWPAWVIAFLRALEREARARRGSLYAGMDIVVQDVRYLLRREHWR